MIDYDYIKSLYEYYLYNIRYVINKMGYKYCFQECWSIIPVNLNEYDVGCLTRSASSFIVKYNDRKLDLAIDIVKNGMYLPIFGGRLNHKLNPLLFFVTHGKYRLYILRRYQREIKPIEEKFLFIEYPIDIQYYSSSLSQDRLIAPIELYDLVEGAQPGMANVIKTQVRSHSDIYNTIEHFGHLLTECIYQYRESGGIVVSPFTLINEDAFRRFLETGEVCYERR